MAWLQRYSLLFSCLLAFLVVETTPFREYGVVTSNNGMFKFIGDSLELYCNITSTTLRENSSMLHFERWTNNDKSVIPSEYVEILTTKTIRLRLSNMSINDGGVYTCFQQTFTGDTRVIDSQIIEVDYKPQKVKNISCRVYNWEQMNCSWDLGVKFRHPDYVKVSLAWTIQLPIKSRSHGDQFDCPSLTKTSCHWNSINYSHGHVYLMIVDVSIKVNGTVLIHERSPQFRVETVFYVEPAPVDNLQAKAVNSSCVELSWQHSAIDRQKFFVAESRIVDEDKWGQIILTQEAKERYESLVCSLVPFTNYEFRMSVLPYPIETKEPVSQGHRSEWKTVTAKTFEDVPGAAPKICSGCFYEYKCPQNASLRCVKVYWQDLKQNEKHGILQNYNITFVDSGYGVSNSLLLPVTASKPLISANLTLPAASHNYQISLCPSTSQGFSKSSSSFLLPSVLKRPSAPPNFLVEMDKINESKDIVFYLSWAALNVDAKTGHKYMNVTIVWCPGIRSETECRDEIDWVQLSADHVTYELKIHTEGYRHGDYLIGITAEVSRDGQAVSSGIHWSTCTYHRNEPPQNPPKNIRESSKHPNNGLTILWDKPECSEEKSFITEYLVKYCPSNEGKKCYEPEISQNVSNAAGEVTLEHLKIGVRYMITVIAISSAGLGPPESILSVVVKGFAPGPDSTGTVAIIVGTVGFVICLLCCVCLVRHCYRRRNKLPNVSDLIQPYAQTSVDYPNKIHGFQNRPLPKTPEEQHFYGLSARMNNLGSDQSPTVDNHNSESNSEESITSQTKLLSSEAQIIQTSLIENSNKVHLKNGSALKDSKEMQVSNKETQPLLVLNSSGNINGPFNANNSNSMLEHNTGSAVLLDYSTMGYVDNNDIHNNIHNNTHKQKADNASTEASSSSFNHSSSDNLADYHLFSTRGSRSIDLPDTSLLSFSNSNTLPLRERNMEKPDCPALHTGLQAVDQFSTAMLIDQGDVHGLSQPLVYTINKPKNSDYSQKFPAISSYLHNVGKSTLLNVTSIDSLPKSNKSEYMAHSQMARQPSTVNNQPEDYSRFAEIPQSQKHSDFLQPCLNCPPSSTPSPPSSCSNDTHGTICSLSHCYPSYNSSDTQPHINSITIEDSVPLAQNSVVPINDYTRWEDIPKAAPIIDESAISTCHFAASGKEVTDHPSFVMNISPVVNSDIYVDHLPNVSSLPNEQGIASEYYDYNSAGATFPRSVGRDSMTLTIPSPLPRPLSGDLLQLPPAYYEDPKLGGSHEILTEL